MARSTWWRTLLIASILLLAANLLIISLMTHKPPSVRGREKVVGYVRNWVDLASFSETIDYSKVTHINVAFENPVNDRGELSFNQADEALITKAHSRGVKVLVSIGGGGVPDNSVLKARYFDLIADAKRAGFVEKVSGYLVDHGFDGLDVDLEGPAINDDYGAFISELASTLKQGGKLLTAALSRGYGGGDVPDSALEQLDFLNVMAYDDAGSWDPARPGQHSSLDFAKGDVEYWAERGVPASKIVLGVPSYGYGFGKAFRKDPYPYAEIVASYPGAGDSDQVGETIWYNGVPTIEAKTRYAADRGLGGMMIWTLDHDVKGEVSLLDAISRVYVSRSAAAH